MEKVCCLPFGEALPEGLLLLPSFPSHRTQACLGSAVASQCRIGVCCLLTALRILYVHKLNTMFHPYDAEINFRVHILAQYILNAFSHLLFL